MIKKISLFCLLFCIGFQGYSANVIWGTYGEDSFIYPTPTSSAVKDWFWGTEESYLHFFFTQSIGDDSYSMTSADFAYGHHSIMAIMYNAEAGDLIDGGVGSRNELFWDFYGDSGQTLVGKTITIDKDKTFYLGIVLVDVTYDEGPRYGWVEFGLDGDKIIPVASALDLDGSSIYVGSGAIPEPRSAMLLLLGLAGVSLKRKRIAARARSTIAASGRCISKTMKYTDENLSRKRNRTCPNEWPIWRSGI